MSQRAASVSSERINELLLIAHLLVPGVRKDASLEELQNLYTLSSQLVVQLQDALSDKVSCPGLYWRNSIDAQLAMDQLNKSKKRRIHTHTECQAREVQFEKGGMGPLVISHGQQSRRICNTCFQTYQRDRKEWWSDETV